MSGQATVVVVDPILAPTLLSTDMPHGMVDLPYTTVLEAAGGDGAYTWSISAGLLPPGVTLAANGTISGTPTEGGFFDFTVEVESAGRRSSGALAIMVFQSEPLATWIGSSLGGVIAYSIQYNQELLPRNPHLAEYIQAKVAMLQEPGLDKNILRDGNLSETVVELMDGRSIPSMIVFPVDTMATGAMEDLNRSGRIIQTLEGFLGVPWPQPWVRNRYGFTLGNRGGGGTVYMEDRGTYSARGGGTRFHLHDAILAHEFAHSYIGHEWLTQFLHLYVHNLIETDSQDIGQWEYFNLEEYVPFSPDNQKWRALLDIYQLIGPDAMGDAYRELHLLGVPYGSLLSQAARQAFIDRAPAAVRDQVATLTLRID